MRKRYPQREHLQQALRRYGGWDAEQLEQHIAMLTGRLLAANMKLETKGRGILAPATVRGLEWVYAAFVPKEAYE